MSRLADALEQLTLNMMFSTKVIRTPFESGEEHAHEAQHFGCCDRAVASIAKPLVPAPVRRALPLQPAIARVAAKRAREDDSSTATQRSQPAAFAPRHKFLEVLSPSRVSKEHRISHAFVHIHKHLDDLKSAHSRNFREMLQVCVEYLTKELDVLCSRVDSFGTNVSRALISRFDFALQRHAMRVAHILPGSTRRTKQADTNERTNERSVVDTFKIKSKHCIHFTSGQLRL